MTYEQDVATILHLKFATTGTRVYILVCVISLISLVCNRNSNLIKNG